MITQLFKKKKEINLERTYDAPIQAVWRAWTDPAELRQWWCPEKTSVTDCEVDPKVGGRIYVVTEAGEGMGKYKGTRWPMDGTFTDVSEPGHLTYEARSWTEGEEEGTTIEHVNELTLTEAGGKTTVQLHIEISSIGPKAKMAVMGMKMGYKQQLKHLTELLANRA
jgi:uncharacterized protein YndB with AHSA1/START domain